MIRDFWTNRRGDAFMKIKKIVNQLPIDQFDVELQGCSNDCAIYPKKDATTVKLQESQGIPSDTKTGIGGSGAKLAVELFGVYCYRDYNAKTTTLW